MGFVRRVLGRFSAESRRVRGKFWRVFGRFSAYLQRVLEDSRFGEHCNQFLDFWRAGAPKMVPGWPKRWPQGSQEAPKNDKKRSLFFKAFLGASQGARIRVCPPNLASFWDHFGAKNPSKIDPKVGRIFDAVLQAFWLPKWSRNQCQNQSKTH